MGCRGTRFWPDIRFQSADLTRRVAVALGFVLVYCYLLPSPAFAMPGWGEISKRELTEANLDSRANVYQILNQQEIVFNDDGTSVSKIKRAFYVLSVAGAESFVQPIPISAERRVKKFKSWKLSPGKIESSYKQSDMKYFRPPVEDNVYHDLAFGYIQYQPLTPGVIIAEEFELLESGLTVYNKYVTVKRQEPVRKVLIKAKAPNGWGAFMSSYRGEDLEYERKGDWAVWRGADLPYEPDEPLMPDWNTLAHSIQISCYDSARVGEDDSSGVISQGQFTDWRSVANWVGRIYDTLAAPTEEITRLVDSLAGNAHSPEERVRVIGDFVKKEVRYVSVALGDGRFVPRKPELTLKSRYGDCKDKTTLTRAMLSVAGFKTAATLTSVKSPVNDFQPTPYQFDHCIVAVELEDSLELPEHVSTPGRHWMIIDPTDDVTPVGELSASIRGRGILIAEDIDSALQSTPYIEADEWPTRYRTTAILGEDGSLTATTIIVNDEAHFWYEKASLETVTDKEFENQWKDDLKNLAPRATLNTVSRDCDDDSCWTTLTFTIPRYALKAGRQLFCKADPLAPGYERRLTAPARTQYIWFGPPHVLTSEVVWSFPENMILVTPAEDSDRELLPGEVSQSLEVTENGPVTYKQKLIYTGELLNPEEYAEAQSFDSLLAANSGKMLTLAIENTEGEHK